MRDPWQDLLEASEREPPVIDAPIAVSWPQGLLAEWHRQGLLAELPPAEGIVCGECPDLPVHTVRWFDLHGTGDFQAYVSCSSRGAYEVPPPQLKRWRVDLSALCQELAESLELRGDLQEVEPNRLWKLGRRRAAGPHVPVYCGRRLSHRDAAEIVQRLPPRSVLLVLRGSCRCSLPEGVACVELAAATDWGDGEIVWDPQALDRLVARADAATKGSVFAARPLPKRASRAADIERLTRELAAHVRSARDYAFDARDRTGTPQLLPRPTQKELARRLGITESRISRSLHDGDAHQLRFLWELAVDLDRLMTAG